MALNLTTTKLLMLTLAAFRTRVPQLRSISTDFSDGTLRLGETVKAHIPTIPTVGTYDATTGYRNGAVEARSLLADVDVVVDSHKHVTLKWKHLTAIADQKTVIEPLIGNAAYALGKAMLDSVLAKVLAANASYKVEEVIANVDRDTLAACRKLMNANGASAEGRVIIGNSDFVGNFGDDQRISSKLYSGQQTEANAYSHWQNVEGFRDIWEYPDMPANGEDLMGVALEPRAIALRAGIPDATFNLAKSLGIPSVANTEVMTDPETGFSLLAINWQEPGTFDLNCTLVSIWGSAVGRQGGDAGAVTDKALVRFVDTTP
jgi:hypothetical protein